MNTKQWLRPGRLLAMIIILWSGTPAWAGGGNSDSLVVYEVPRAVLYALHNDDFTVQVRTPGGDWQDLYEYKVQVDLDQIQDASMVYFDFSGTVEVRVRKNNGLVQHAAVRPLSFGITPRVTGNVIEFTLDRPRNLSIEVNGDRLHNLHLFASALETERPDANDPNVLYFGPGVHEPPDKPGNMFHVESGQTVYIHGAAIVKGKLLCNRVKNVRIIGRGIILQAERGVEIRHSDHVEIDGIHVINPAHYTIYGGGSTHLKIRNLTSVSCKGWSDGIDLMSCSEVEIDNVFMRNSDDCIALYAHRWDFYGNARNITVTNAILWADIAHPTNIGMHGNAEHAGDTIENITFRNIDILEHDEDDRNYQGCMSIVATDKNLVRHVTYDDVRVEDIQEGQLLNIRVFYNGKYSAAPGRGVRDVLFKNISCRCATLNPSVIHGYDATRQVSGITFSNVTVNGKKITKAVPGQLMIGNFVENIKFE